MKTAISISDDLFNTAELLARRLGLSRSELYRRAIAAFIERHREQMVTSILDEVYGTLEQESHLDPLLEQLQHASVPEERW